MEVFMINQESLFRDAPYPYWIATSPQAEYPQLDHDISVDVAIVGGGIVGVTAAYLLTEQGCRVAVIDADRILHGTTGHTTAKITSQHGLIYANIRNQYGEDLARQYAEANETAVHMIANMTEEKNIDCDFSWRPAYVFTHDDQYIQQIEDEASVATDLGIKAEVVDEIPLPFEVKAALRFDNQAQFHPLKYLSALVRETTDRGGLIFEKTPVVNLEGNGSNTVITRDGKKVKADKVIIATHFPFFDGGGLYFTRIYQEKSYIVAAEIEEAFPEGTFITAEDPGRSLRSQNDGNRELVLFAGEHHKTGHGVNTNVHYQNLTDYANQNFTVKQVAYRWSTQDCTTIDKIPYTGHLTARSPHIYVATGFGKWGMSNGTASAMILKDLIVHGDNPWAQVYNPSRSHSLSAIKSFIIQNADVAKSFIQGKMEPMKDHEEIPVGEARIVEIEGQKAGVFRDEADVLHLVDITCTHLGCELEWNDAERTWDCPCHGSRFSVDGDVVEGPAVNCLHHKEAERNQVEARIFS